MGRPENPNLQSADVTESAVVAISLPPATADAIGIVEGFTRQIFAGKVSMTQEHDPELAGDRHFVVTIVDTGDIDEILAREDQWYARLRELPEEMRGAFRLVIDAR